MRSQGEVREWHDDDGWGVIDSPDTPGGCWAHYSSVLVEDYRSLQPGQDVTLEFETGGQDGLAYRATAVWPTGETPVHPPVAGPSAAYTSSLEITVDDEPGAP